MRRKWFAALLVIAAALVAVFGFRPAARAQETHVAAADLNNVQVITYSSGLTGFFDRSSGMLYVYDGNWDKCIYIRKIATLGEAMEKIRDPKKS